LFDFLGSSDQRGFTVRPCHRSKGDFPRFAEFKSAHGATVGEIDRLIRHRGTGEAQHRSAEQHLDLGTGYRLTIGQRAVGHVAAGLPVDIRQAEQALGCQGLRESHVHHHDARQEPGQHQQPHRDPEIAVQDH
jgi:hypothetical protein